MRLAHSMLHTYRKTTHPNEPRAGYCHEIHKVRSRAPVFMGPLHKPRDVRHHQRCSPLPCWPRCRTPSCRCCTLAIHTATAATAAVRGSPSQPQLPSPAGITASVLGRGSSWVLALCLGDCWRLGCGQRAKLWAQGGECIVPHLCVFCVRVCVCLFLLHRTPKHRRISWVPAVRQDAALQEIIQHPPKNPEERQSMYPKTNNKRETQKRNSTCARAAVRARSRELLPTLGMPCVCSTASSGSRCYTCNVCNV